MQVPEGWVRAVLKDLSFIDKKNLSSTKTDPDFPITYISLSDVEKGNIISELELFLFKSAPSRARRIVSEGDILFATVRPNLQGFAKVKKEHHGYIASTGFAVLTVKENISNEYIYQYLYSHNFSYQVNSLVVGTNYPAINSSEVAKLKILIPKSLAEQEKIAEILSTWDQTIEQTERLKTNAEMHRKALMQQLLTGKKRFPEFRGEWEEYRLKDVAIINPRKAKKPNNHLVSFLGMADVSEDGKILTSEERQYDDVSKGFSSFKDNDVLIAKITPCFENGKGAIVSNLINGIGFGSTEFHVVRTKENKLFPLYLFYLTYLAEFRVRGERNMQGSAGQKRVPTDYLATYKIKLPSLEEQQKIASVLNTADREIELLTKKIEHLKSEKRALMQQLLTGKRRVKI